MWIAYSLLLFVASVALYLTVRKSALEKIPSPLTNLAMFALPLVAYGLIGTISGQNFRVSAVQFFMILFMAVVLSYGGNTASLRAIQQAPNPGYSLVLSKSYVLFTTIVAVLFLDAELDTRKALAILIIISFSALVLVNRSQSHHATDKTWVWLSIGAFFAWGFLSLLSKYLFNNGVATVPFLFYVNVIVTVCIVVASRIRLSSFRGLSRQKWLLLVGTGAFSTLFNLGQFEAIRLAPNVGYVNAINAGSIALVTVLAVVLFKDELTKQKSIGIIGVTAGLVLLLV